MEKLKRKLDRLASESIIAANEKLLTNDEKEKGSDVSHMTSSRLFARFMSRYSFYHPYKHQKFRDNETLRPSLDAAWAFYENVTLARVCANRKTEDGDLIRAQVGDSIETRLYPYWETSLKDLNSFGISVRMYFATVFILGCFLLGAGILNLPLMAYYWTYAGDVKERVPFIMRASAMCGEAEWVQCESCNSDEYKDYFPAYRIDGENVLKNQCDFDNWLYPGIHSWIVSLILIGAFIIAFYIYQAKAEIIFDEEVQTTSDYSVKIVNPPKDALDPEEWRGFFSSFANDQIVSVSINVNNADLLHVLIKRRKAIKQLKKLLPVNSDIHDVKAIGKARKYWYMHLPFFSDAHVKYEKIQKLNQKIKALADKEYFATDVFVIFETERGQRNALHTLSTGRMDVWRNNRADISKFALGKLVVEENLNNVVMEDLGKSIRNLDEEKESITIRLAKSDDVSGLRSILHFRGEKVLRLKEAPEPFDVRWKDLQVGFAVRWMKCVISVIILATFISWSGFFIYRLSKESGPAGTAVYISATNVIVPKICELINGFEPHATEGKRQASLYIKMALFRCFNSAIALLIVINFTGTISIEDGKEEARSLLHSVYSVIFAELFTIPIIKLCDFLGNYRKHILAPRASNQEEMNSYMRGGKFELAERYTDSTKVLFVALFYSAILPETYFLGALACFIHFFFGKFCLLRMWRKAPDIGKDLARLSRNTFFTTSFVVHMFTSAYFWSGFPYDFVCDDNNDDDDNNGGDSYQFCNQDLFGSRQWPLPRYQSEAAWMSPTQELITSLYGWSSIVLILMCFIFFVKNALIPLISGLWYSTYEPDGKDQQIGFHTVKHLDGVSAYIPQLRENGFEYPLIACNIESIDHDLVGWRDHRHGFEPHNLINDVKEILGESTSSANKNIFSIVKYWPPSKRYEPRVV